MIRLRVLAVLPAVAAVCLVELVRRHTAPCLFGAKQWASAWHLTRDPAVQEADVFA